MLAGALPDWLQFGRQNRGRLFWWLQAGGWGMLVGMAAFMSGAGGVERAEAIAIGAFRAVLGFGLTSVLLHPALRVVRRRRTIPAVITGIVLCAGLLAWIDTAATNVVVRLAGMETPQLRQFMHTSLMLRGILYGAWGGLYFIIHYWLDTQEAHLRMARLEAENRTAELQQLRAQMNPHFLFNAFNSILAEAANPKVVTALTEGVSEYLRFSLHQTEAIQRLGDELKALEHYLQVEKIRFEDELEITVEADARARNCRVPGALVQPLVENAIKYGQRTSPRPLRIAVEAGVTGGWLVVTVSNTGRWIAPKKAARGGGIGLSNLRRRLELLHGERAACEVVELDGWVRARLRLPAEEGA